MFLGSIQGGAAAFPNSELRVLALMTGVVGALFGFASSRAGFAGRRIEIVSGEHVG
jgi:hypothetical protein